MSFVQRIGFYVNAVKHVFHLTKVTTQKILWVQFVTEEMIVVAPYMVSSRTPFLKYVPILPRGQIIQHLMRRTAQYKMVLTMVFYRGGPGSGIISAVIAKFNQFLAIEYKKKDA